MKARGGGLVCFPPRTQLALMPPKSTSSPSRPSNRARGHASPMFKSNRTAHAISQEEPTSPTVTCSGQIKVRGEGRRRSKGLNWWEAIGLKKDFMQLFTALRGLRLKVACFGSMHGAQDCTTDEEDSEEEEDSGSSNDNGLAKWFMVLEEESKRKEERRYRYNLKEKVSGTVDGDSCVAPPPNALLLMRCRSAPSKGLCRREEDEEEEKNKVVVVKEEEVEKERLVFMRYSPEFFKLSDDIAKETWVVGSVDPLVRCRSSKR